MKTAKNLTVFLFVFYKNRRFQKNSLKNVQNDHIPRHIVIAVLYKGGIQVKLDQDEILEELYRTYYRLLVVHAYRLLGDWDDANYAAQDAFHVACKKIEQLTHSENQIGWLKNTVRNVCYRMIRDRNRQALLFSSLDDLTDAEAPVTSDDPDAPYMDMLEELVSKDEIALLKKIILEGVSYNEAAKELGCTEWACRKRVQRSIEKIRQKYRDKFGEDFSP